MKSLNPDISDRELLALARWAQARKAETARRTMHEAAATYRGPIERLPAGKAYGTGELQRKHGGAIAMQFYRKGGGA